MKICVAILNWNGAEMLRRFLPSVLQYSQTERTEVCVIDNASTDHSLEVLRQEFPTVRIIALDCNYGFADGYNKGMQHITAEYVVLLNSDVEVSENWLTPLITYMDTHPEVAACQPKLRWQRHPALFEYAGAAGGFMDRDGYPFCRGRVFDTVEVDKGQYDTITPIFWASGAALFVRRAVYEAVGGLDGNFFAHMEEIDFCWRLRSRGHSIVCIPQSVVYHVGGATLHKDSPQKTYLNFRNNLLMLYKNLPDVELAPVLRRRYWWDRLALLFFLLKGEWKNAQAVWKARKDFQKMRPDYASVRAHNLEQTTSPICPERTAFSLLWRSKIKGKRTFSSLFR